MRIFIMLIMFLSVSCSNSQSVSDQTANVPINSNQPKLISEDEAVKIAENFIIENGYTDLPPTDDKTKVVFESVEWISDITEILKERHSTLQKKAYGMLKGGKDDAEGSTVVFLYTDRSFRKTGRAVTVSSEGKNLRVQHKDFFLKAVQKKL